jgi:hypothetical protein
LKGENPRQRKVIENDWKLKVDWKKSILKWGERTRKRRRERERERERE